MGDCQHEWRRDRGSSGWETHNSFTCAKCGADRLRVAESDLSEARALVRSLREHMKTIQARARSRVVDLFEIENLAAEALSELPPWARESGGGLDGTEVGRAVMRPVLTNPFAGPIAALKEDCARIAREIVLQRHQGAEEARLRQMIADNENAIATLESLRE